MQSGRHAQHLSHIKCLIDLCRRFLFVHYGCHNYAVFFLSFRGRISCYCDFQSFGWRNDIDFGMSFARNSNSPLTLVYDLIQLTFLLKTFSLKRYGCLCRDFGNNCASFWEKKVCMSLFFFFTNGLLFHLSDAALFFGWFRIYCGERKGHGISWGESR